MGVAGGRPRRPRPALRRPQTGWASVDARSDHRLAFYIHLVLCGVMLATLRQAAPSALRQCRSSAAATSHITQHVRALASSSVLRDQSQGGPRWLRTAEATPPNNWHFLMGAVKEGTKTQKASNPEDIWMNKENTDVAQLPPPNNAYSGIPHPRVDML